MQRTSLLADTLVNAAPVAHGRHLPANMSSCWARSSLISAAYSSRSPNVTYRRSMHYGMAVMLDMQNVLARQVLLLLHNTHHSTGVLHHESHGLCRDLVCIYDQVPFVLTVLIVQNHHELACSRCTWLGQQRCANVLLRAMTESSKHLQQEFNTPYATYQLRGPQERKQ
eukprot:GHUV01021350.1.p1 GENE.GHUV01021350.1~~GHUV01021350.1.p1  ORF type:complete len:169 (-),score=20.05 GHUV01021350.1:420-926(-)